MSTRVWHRMVIAVLSIGLASLSVQAQMVSPLANTTVGNARLLVPDGSSLRQSIGAGETRWFVFGAEPGKTYVVEAVDPDSDLPSNTIGALNVYAANGTTTPPPETNVDCTSGNRAPALDLATAVDGMRCVVRSFPPSPGNTQNKRALYVAVGLVAGPSFDIRVRESTIYGRWTTNGYDFHVELENTTADAMCAEVIFLPNAGESYAGTWSGGLTRLQLTVPAFGANKLVFPNGTLVNADNKGTLRIGACASPTNFVPTALHVSTYAYNPLTDKFLYFFTNAANNGATANSWSAASGASTANAFVQGGNAFGTTANLGTTDGTALQFIVSNARALRIDPDSVSPLIVGGLSGNSVTAGASGATIGGGGATGATVFGIACGTSCANRVTDAFGTVGGGAGNQAGDGAGTSVDKAFATVGGGLGNTASGQYSAVSGGYTNTASGIYASVAGGGTNQASGIYAAVAGGLANQSSGYAAFVAGGVSNQASGIGAFAGGSNAKALHDGQFVWADIVPAPFDPASFPSGWSDATNTFTVRATGGVWFVSGVNGSGVPLNGCSIGPNGGMWGCTSSREAKTDFEPADVRRVLDRVVELPLQFWRFKGEPSGIRHIGPMAEDFYTSFALGRDNKTIGTGDADGIALAAIQGLNAKVEEQASMIGEQQHEIADLRERVSATESLRGELAALRAELADLREARTQITARAPAAAYGSQADAAR